MEKFAEFLNKKKNLRILDVGTGAGNFIGLIKSLYGDYKKIIGIDTIEGAVNVASKNYADDEKITFKVMDALKMDFEDESFDLVCLSNSLHHLVDVKAIMKEMERVLSKGGYIVISEMISNDLDSRQISHMKVHHFSAKIDRERGEVHNDTFSDGKIIEILNNESSLHVEDSWRLDFERASENTDEEISWLENTLDRLVERVIDPIRKIEYEKEALEIKEYIRKNGFDSCTTLIAVMKK